MYEYKKQSGTQWFDLSKLAKLTKKQKSIDVLFFIHKGGVFQAAYSTTYQGVIEAIGLSKKDWAWAKKAPETAQVKYALKRKQIETFHCLTPVTRKES